MDTPKTLLSSLVAMSSVVFTPLLVFATDRQYPGFQPPPRTNVGPVTRVDSALGVLVRVVDFAQVAFWIVAAGFGLYAAYLYLFSQGDKEAINKAKKMLLYTIVASALAIIAYGIPAIIYNFLTV